MEVYDSDGNIIGHVNFVRFGEGGVDANLPDIITMREVVEFWLGRTTHFPTTMYADIYRDGYIRIGRGFFRSDVIALPGQVADVGEETLYLEIPLSDLPTC
jgi:hypothetical protein